MIHDPNLLSRREWEVLELAAEGKSNQEVADGLCISVHTVERHLTHIFEKLRVKNRTQASKMYCQVMRDDYDGGNPG